MGSPGLIESVSRNGVHKGVAETPRDAKRLRALLSWSHQKIRRKCDLASWGSTLKTTSWASMQRNILISKQGGLGNCQSS